jgi:lysyl-tRNA synthetase class I
MSKPIPTNCPKCGKALTSKSVGDGKVHLTCSCGQLDEVRDREGRKLLIDSPAPALSGGRRFLTS